jgi:hypothetical protein
MENYKLSKCALLEVIKDRHDLDDVPLFQQMFLNSEQQLAQLLRLSRYCRDNCTRYDDCTRQDEQIEAVKKELQMI